LQKLVLKSISDITHFKKNIYIARGTLASQGMECMGPRSTGRAACMSDVVKNVS